MRVQVVPDLTQFAAGHVVAVTVAIHVLLSSESVNGYSLPSRESLNGYVAHVGHVCVTVAGITHFVPDIFKVSSVLLGLVGPNGSTFEGFGPKQLALARLLEGV